MIQRAHQQDVGPRAPEGPAPDVGRPGPLPFPAPGALAQRYLVSIHWADGRSLTQLVRATSKAIAWRYAWERAGDPEDMGSVKIASVQVVLAA